MPNNYFNEEFTGQAGQTARASQVEVPLQAVEAAFDAITLDVNRSIKGPSGETLTDLPTAVNRANKFLRFDANGNPEAIQSGFTWRDDWAQPVTYAVGDVVKFGVYETLYICIAAHTSSAGVTPTDVTKWDILVDRTGDNRIQNEIKTASFTAVVGGDYLVDSAGGNITITLPASPTIDDAPINITHIGGTLGAGQLITVARNGQLIMGLAEDLSIDVVNSSISLMFADASRGWRLRVLA